MPRVPRALVIDTTLAQPARQQLPAPANLDQPDQVACIRCGESSAASAEKCPGCGLRFDDAAQNTRLNVALKQKLAAGERAHREQVAKSRTVDPGLATSVVGALGLVVIDSQQLREAAAAEVDTSKERLEKAQAALWANDCAETRDSYQRAQLQAMAAPGNLALAEAALKHLAELQPMAAECDQLQATAMPSATFRAELAKRMQAVRVHLDAAVSEIVGAYELQRQHESGAKAATAKRTKLDEKLTAIRRSFSLRTKLPYGFGHISPYVDVSQAAAQVVIDALRASSLGNALVDDLRARIRWQ